MKFNRKQLLLSTAVFKKTGQKCLHELENLLFRFLILLAVGKCRESVKKILNK